MRNRLEILRKQKGLTQSELAKLAGIGQPAVALMEKGKRDIDTEMLIKLARALNVKAYELLPEEEQPETLTSEERAFIDLFRKSKQTTAEDVNQTAAG